MRNIRNHAKEVKLFIKMLKVNVVIGDTVTIPNKKVVATK